MILSEFRAADSFAAGSSARDMRRQAERGCSSMMNNLVVIGIIAIVAGLLILIEPAFLTAIVAAILIAGGAIAIYAGTHGVRLT
jgi:uncharacterized membrane protein HdeD (DUF308 family)